MECGCLPCDRCREVEWPEYRNKICAAISGGLFSVGWWLAIGMQCIYNINILQSQLKPSLLADASVSDADNTKDLYHLCGVFSALSMFMVNTVSNGHLQGDALYTDGLLGGVAAKIWFFLGLLIGFG